jgi:hypothetical protein
VDQEERMSDDLPPGTRRARQRPRRSPVIHRQGPLQRQLYDYPSAWAFRTIWKCAWMESASV